MDGVPGWLIEFFFWLPAVGAVAGFVALVVAVRALMIVRKQQKDGNRR